MVFIELFAIFLCLTCAINGSDKNENRPVFTTSPEDTFLPHDQQLTLKCFATGHPVPSITWYKDGEIVQTHRDKPGTSNRITNHGELIILRFGPSDEGVYYCNASNINGWTKSASANVHSAFFDSSNAQGPESKVVNVGDTAVLECTPPSGLPKPVISWTRDGIVLTEGSRLQIIDHNNLRIHPVKQSDAGSYQCRSENFAGHWESTPAVLKVQRKPRFASTPGNKQAVVGESVDFQCLAADIPNSTIVWRKSVGKMHAKLWNKRSLRIENVQLSDAGDYVCEVKNTHGRAEAVAHLSVISPPTFLVTPDDRTVPVGGSATFDCVASGTPPPAVRWIHKGETLWVPLSYELFNPQDRRQVFPNGTLIINSVSMADEGIYECRASQLAGIVKSLSRLFVETPFSQPLPVIELGPQNLTLYSGMIATFPCQASVLRYPRFSPISSGHSFPEITTHWFINGVRVSPPNDRRIVLFNSGSLQLHAVRPSDAGVYTCQVEVEDFNRGTVSSAVTSWSAHLTVIPDGMDSDSRLSNVEGKSDDLLLPQPPDRIELLSVGDTWITILIDLLEANMSTSKPEWPLEYRVEYAEYNSSSSWQLAVASVKAREVRIEHLKPLTGYYILVRGVNKNGIGKPRILEQVVYTSALSTKDSADQIQISSRLQSIHFSPLRSKPLSPSEALIEWSNCGSVSALSEINAHRITAKPVPLSRCLSLDTKVNGYVLQQYDENPKLLDSQCPLEDVLGDYEINDEFAHCSLSELREKYDLLAEPPLFLTKEHMEINAELVTGNSLLKRAVVPELKPFLCYSIEVEPVGTHSLFGHLFGQKSKSSTVLTYDSSPTGAPKIFRVVWIQNGTVLELHWHPPAMWEQGGVLTGYTMRVIGPSTHSNRNLNFGPEQRSYRLKALDPRSNYTIYVAAVNCRGEGIRSSPVHVFAYLMTDPTDAKMPQNYPNLGVYRRVIYDGREAVTSGLVMASPQSQLEADVLDTSPSEERANLIREPWFIVSVVAFSLLWILVVLGLVLCGRHRSRRQRRRATVLDPVDVGTVTKNGRLGPASETYPLSLANTPLLPTSTPDLNGMSGANALAAHTMVPGNDAHFYGDQRKLGNGFPAMLSQQNGLIPVVSFPGSVVCNGSVQPTFTYYPHYSLGLQPVPHMDGLNGTSYITTNSIPLNMSNNGMQGYRTGDTHRPPPHPLTMGAHKGVQLSVLPDRSVSNQSGTGDEIAEDTVSPYASVPVLQQMVFDRGPAGVTSTHPTGSGISQPPLSSGVRQLSLAEIIPPPPDYPPPSVPSCSPPLGPSTGWPQSSGSGDDSAYYAHSDLQHAVAHEPGVTNGTAWSTSGPDDGTTHVLPLDWSHHENSVPHATPRPMIVSSTEQKTSFVG